MATSPAPYPVYQVPTTPAPDAQNGSLNTTQQAAYIDTWFVGPKGSEFIQGVTACSVRKTVQGAAYRPVASMFRQQRTLGNLVGTGTITHYRQRNRPADAILASCYGLSSSSNPSGAIGQLIRYDAMPLTVYVIYALVDATFDYSNVLDQEVWTYPEVYLTESTDGHVTDPNGLATEDITFECQNWMYSGPGLVLVTPGYTNLYAKVS